NITQNKHIPKRSSSDQNNVSKEDKNNIFLKLSRIIETEGAIYNDSYPIGLNLFTYKDKETYLSEEKSPDEKVLDIIEDNDLIKEDRKSTRLNSSHVSNS